MAKIPVNVILRRKKRFNMTLSINLEIFSRMDDTILKTASLGRQEPQLASTVKWPTTLRFGKIFETTFVVRSIENPQDVLQKIHRR